MKRFGFIMMCVATLLFASCSAVKSASSNAVAVADGTTCGYAVSSLYETYKAKGTIDMTNTTNITNAMTLVASYNKLKTNKDDSTYKRSFATGLSTGTNGLLSIANATTFVDKMLASTGLTNVNTNNIVSTVSTVNTLMTLIGTMNQ